ncbi:leucyl aminopeptidase [Pseudoclavibacter chungangensis]|uniref:Probable cytosol aminopeptidase n=1 Tax=Pseudoclavibacter chungangensis TaxID=587635 RepID=A0A7J5BSQ3_9MICO|nr:leucyl aminopeptidase [Pseudoclavibacter chungangensis]KAB1655994.1 leucyl aminopeptidase [Pseudoclavibacter chungangensis]NYJ66441.1 leucyl aminopeptidase [Pseudoclavibacter chungangensis]
MPRFETTETLFAPDTVTAVGVRETEDGVEVLGDDALDPVRPLVGPLRVSGARGRVSRGTVQIDDAIAPVLFVGLGDEASAASWREAAGSLARSCSDDGAVVLALPSTTADIVEAAALGFALGLYRFDTYRTGRSEEDTHPQDVPGLAIHGLDADEAENVFGRVRSIASAVWLARDLVNTPPNDLSPDALATAAETSARAVGIDVTSLGVEALERDGFGGILAVGRGSVRPPRFVRLAWSPEHAVARIALVGKGITFDSGGLSLKPPTSMVGMKSDMSGAAIALAVVTTIASLGVPVAVTGYLCLAENMPSGSATRPDDIITIRGGTTVEVTNTDAEGRLVLADGIVTASEEQPDAIIDIATLTGAQVVALGERTTGVVGNDDAWTQRVLDAAAAVGEPAWPMPIPEELESVLASDVADLKNAKPGHRAAGMLVAAWFLSRFVGDRADGSGPIPWVHLDIAGPSMNSGSAYGVTPKGATGVMVRTLVAAIESLVPRD